MKMKNELPYIMNFSEKLTDACIMKDYLTKVSELRDLLNYFEGTQLHEKKHDIINLLLADNGILESLCSSASDVGAIVNLLPEAKDKIIEKISATPSILSKFVERRGLPSLRPLFTILQSASQRAQLCKTIITNETLLIQSLQSISHLEEMIFTLSTSVDQIVPTVLANPVLLRLFLKEDLEKFIKLFPSYEKEILDNLFKKDVLFKEPEDLDVSTLRALATCFPEQLETIMQKCKTFNEALFDEILHTEKEINKLFAPDRFKGAPLCSAVFNNEKEKIVSLMQQNTNINATCSEGFTALHWACMRRDEALIRELISKGADSNIQNKYGKTALDYYRYQIRVDDFQSTLSYSAYQDLKNRGALASGPASMKEFNLVYWNDSSKVMGAPMRNKKPLRMEIFTPDLAKKPEAKEINPINQPAAIATKSFIASPVFMAGTKALADHGVDAGIQGCKKTNFYN